MFWWYCQSGAMQVCAERYHHCWSLWPDWSSVVVKKISMHVVASWSIGNAGSVSNSVALRNSSKSFGFGHCAPREQGSGPMSQTFWSPGETDQLELPMAVRLSIESAIHHRKGIAPFWPWHMMPRWKPITSDGKWTLFSWWEWSLFKFEWQLMSPPMVVDMVLAEVWWVAFLFTLFLGALKGVAVVGPFKQ